MNKEITMQALVYHGPNLLALEGRPKPAVIDATDAITATVTTGARNLAGNALAKDHVWNFTALPPPATERKIRQNMKQTFGPLVRCSYGQHESRC